MNEKAEKGKQGEEYAIRFLADKGYTLIDRNFYSLNSEIDLIVKKDDLMVFVEVRMKANADFGYPELTLSKAKVKAIMRGAEEYLIGKPYPKEVRFDVISILEYPEFEIVHFEDVFH